jgi:hypothetical protein
LAFRIGELARFVVAIARRGILGRTVDLSERTKERARLP